MLKIKDCMKVNVVSIPVSATIADAVDVIVTRHIGLLPVVDDQMKLVGVVGLSDLLELALPTFMRLVKDLDFVGNFGAVESYLPDWNTLHQPVKTIMRTALPVHEDCRLLRAYALMLKHDFHDLPIVDAENRLCGIASRVDIGTTILSTWQTTGRDMG